MPAHVAVTLLAAGMFAVAAVSAIVGGLVALPPSGWQRLVWPQRARLAHVSRVAPVLNAADWAGERVGTRASAVFELRWPRVTVDAFIFSRYLVVTDAAADLLSDDELLALCVREITFFQQPWLTGTLRIMDSALIFFMLACTVVGMTLGGHAILVGTLVGFGTAYLMRPLLRRTQLKADALAAHSAIDPAAALRALERQYELNLKPVVAASDRSREPHLYDRMTAAGIPPAYPRPQPPSTGRIVLSLVAAVVTFLMLSLGFLIVAPLLLRLFSK